MTRIRRFLSVCVFIVMGVVFAYGLIRFPDGPIHQCDAARLYAIKVHPGGYCGKQGQPHTLADFHAFESWQTVLWIVWPVGFLALIFIHYGRINPSN